MFDIASNTWQTMTQKLKVPRENASACVAGDYIYLYGGHANGKDLNIVERIPIQGLTDSSLDWEIVSTPASLEMRKGHSMIPSGPEKLTILGGN